MFENKVFVCKKKFFGEIFFLFFSFSFSNFFVKKNFLVKKKTIFFVNTLTTVTIVTIVTTVTTVITVTTVTTITITMALSYFTDDR